MSYLTKEEKFLLLFLGFVIFFGSTVHFLFKKFPSLRDSVHLIDTEFVSQKLDVNTATFEEFVNLPYIGEKTARQIIDYRKIHGRFVSVDELKRVSGIKEKNFERFKAYLKCSQGSAYALSK